MTMSRNTGTAAARQAWAWWDEARPLLRYARNRKGYTQRRLALELGLTDHQGAVSLTESGTYSTLRMPRLTRWFRVVGLELIVDGPQETILIGDWAEETRTAVGRIVRNLRAVTAMNQAALALRADCAKSTVQQIEAGRSAPRVTTLAAMFLALGWTPFARFAETTGDAT